jgi:hypothetical protein
VLECECFRTICASSNEGVILTFILTLAFCLSLEYQKTLILLGNLEIGAGEGNRTLMTVQMRISDKSDWRAMGCVMRRLIHARQLGRSAFPPVLPQHTLRYRTAKPPTPLLAGTSSDGNVCWNEVGI